MTDALHEFCPQTRAYFGDNGIPYIAVFRGNADFHQLMVFERKIDLPHHGLGQSLGSKADDRSQLLPATA